MRILVTLKPARVTSAHHCFGILAEIDWSSQSVVRTLKVPAAVYNHESSFMTSVLQGLCVTEDRVFCAAWNFLLEIDYHRFEIVNAVSYPLMADLHGMDTDGEHVWVTSTAIDTLLCLRASDLSIEWRWGPDEGILQDDPTHHDVDPARREATGTPSERATAPHGNTRRFEETEYRHLRKGLTGWHRHHVNDVVNHDGLLYVMTKGWDDHCSSAVIELDPISRRSSFYVRPGGFRGMHDGTFVDGRLFVTESGANSVAWRELDGSIESLRLDPAPRFVRGLCYTDPAFLIGFSTPRNAAVPACIAEYDLRSNKCCRRMDLLGFYPEALGTGIHAIRLAPR